MITDLAQQFVMRFRQQSEIPMKTLRWMVCSVAVLSSVAQAVAEVKSWTGGGSNTLWSNPANWNFGVPGNGDSVAFRNAGSTTNDLPSLSLATISVDPSWGSLTLKGNRIDLEQGFGVWGGNIVIETPLTLTASQRWSFLPEMVFCPACTVALNGAIDLNGNSLFVQTGCLTLQGCTTVSIGGKITGNGDLRLSPSRHVVLINGDIDIGGSLDVDYQSAIVLNHPATLRGELVASMDATVYVNAPLTVGSLTSLSSMGRLRMNASVTVTDAQSTEWHGTISGTGTLFIKGGTQILTHTDFTGPAMSVDGPGTLVLVDTAIGTTNVNGGTLVIGRTMEPFKWRIESSSVGDVTFDAMSILQVTNDSFAATGSVSLGNCRLVLPPDPLGGSFTVIRNDGGAPVNGIFAGLPEGSTLAHEGVVYQITYHGGASGHDVVLTAISLPTRTTLDASVNPAYSGEEVTFHTTVRAGSNPVPMQSVVIFDGDRPWKTLALDASGEATVVSSDLAVGRHPLSARFLGSNVYSTSTSPMFIQSVSPTLTRTTLSAPTRVWRGQPVTLTASVRGGGTRKPAGTIEFQDGNLVIGSAVVDEFGNAILETSFMNAGPHTLTAIYLGDRYFERSASAEISQEVANLLWTETALTTSSNPSHAGDSVVVSVFVRSPEGNPGGSVSLIVSTRQRWESAPLDSDGRATMVIAGLEAGWHKLMAFYPGAERMASSTSSIYLQEVLAAECHPPQVAIVPEYSTVPPQGSTALQALPFDDPTARFDWYLGRYPDTSAPLTGANALLTLADLVAKTEVWVNVSNPCGSAHASATIWIEQPPRRRPSTH